jgi:hypothetical protein
MLQAEPTIFFHPVFIMAVEDIYCLYKHSEWKFFSSPLRKWKEVEGQV